MRPRKHLNPLDKGAFPSPNLILYQDSKSTLFPYFLMVISNPGSKQVISKLFTNKKVNF
jgi:hypothetical protein